MVATELKWDVPANAKTPTQRRERLEHRRRALLEAIELFRCHAVGKERLRLLRWTEEELTRVEAELGRLTRPAG